MPSKNSLFRWVLWLGVAAAGGFLFWHFYQMSVLQKIVQRLNADSRVAEVLVTGVNFDPVLKRNLTTIKFLEYDTGNLPLAPKYFVFAGNVIQFQSLVVRFDDTFVMGGDRVRGKSVYLFWKAFMLDGKDTTEFQINKLKEVPDGYRVDDPRHFAQEKFWRHFWEYAFDPRRSKRAGVKSVQIEAPGAVFIPGYLYTIKIEHDGGLRIDTTPLPEILKGELKGA